MATVQSKNTGWFVGSDAICTTDHNFNMDIETDNVTDMCSDQNTETASEIRTVSGSLNGVFETTGVAYLALKTAFFSTAAGWGQVTGHYNSPDGAAYTGTIQINSLSFQSAHNQEVRFSADLAFTGTIAIS